MVLYSKKTGASNDTVVTKALGAFDCCSRASGPLATPRDLRFLAPRGSLCASAASVLQCLRRRERLALSVFRKTPEEEAFRTHRVYDLYNRIAEQEGSSPLSEDRAYRLLKEQAFLGVTESNHTGGGQGEGSFLEHRLLRDPEIVIKAIKHSDSF